MSHNDDQAGEHEQFVPRSDGTTDAERYLKRLGDQTFLSLWSHAGIYRDQGKPRHSGHGKELCDLLVVFENHIIIFSDKNCKYPETEDPLLNWSRWFRKTVEDSAKQVRGAERWIRQFPGRLFLDRACTKHFPIELPPPEKARFHRIIVAHDSTRCCRRDNGGSGSLAIAPMIVGPMHYDNNAPFPRLYPFGVTPFAIGRIDSLRGYLHVFDDTSLDIVMKTRDTITDFVHYLSKKEALIESGRLLVAAGEEELLATYLKDVNADGEHDFVLPPDCKAFAVHEGSWEEFVRSPARKAQLEVDQISYVWDKLIEAFTYHYLKRTYHVSSCASYADQERMLRLLARESRFRRRMLARAFVELIEKGMDDDRVMRLVQNLKPEDPCYVFMTLKQPMAMSEAVYRKSRMNMIWALCMVAKLRCPDAQDIVGLATEPGLSNSRRSEDIVHLDARDWTAEREAEARDLQQKFGLFTNVREYKRLEGEYPKPLIPNKLFTLRLKAHPRSRRNSLCPCGSGKKYKKCCEK